MYRSISTPERFSPDHLLDQLNMSEEHDTTPALELADRVEAAMYVWRRKASTHHSKSSWKMVKELVSDDEKNVMLAKQKNKSTSLAQNQIKKLLLQEHAPRVLMEALQSDVLEECIAERSISGLSSTSVGNSKLD